MDGELGRYFGVERGVLVATAPEDTPAREAGLLPGDVIIQVGERLVTNPAELSRAIREADGSVVLTVVRAGSEIEIQLK